MPDNTYKNVIKAAIDGFNAIQTKLTEFNASSSSDTTGLRTSVDAVSSLNTGSNTITGNITPSEMVSAMNKLAVIRKSDNSYATGKISLYGMTYTGTGSTSGTTITIGTTSGITLTTGSKYNENDIKINILGAANITASNIKHNVSFLGVTGTFTSDGTATASDILSGKIAYVKGSKITGSVPTVSLVAGSGWVSVDRADSGGGVNKVNATLLYPTSNANYGGILTSNSDLNANSIYYLELTGTGRGTVSTSTGYILAGSQNSNNKVTTYYVPVKAGTITHVGGEVTSGNGMASVANVNLPSGVLSLTRFQGTEGTDYYTVNASGSGKVNISALTYKTTAGYIPANTDSNHPDGVGVSDSTTNLSAAGQYSSNTATVPYYLRKATGQITLQKLAGVVTAENAVLSATNNSGIAVSGSGRVKGSFAIDSAGVLPSGATFLSENNGLVSNVSTSYISDIILGNDSGTARTLDSLTIKATGTLSTLGVNASGKITALNLSGTISNLTGYAGSVITNLGGTVNVTTNTATITIGTNTNGTINLFGGNTQEHGIKITNGIIYADYRQTTENGQTVYKATQVTEMVSTKPSLKRATYKSGSASVSAVSNTSDLGLTGLIKTDSDVGNQSGNYYKVVVTGSGNSAINAAGWAEKTDSLNTASKSVNYWILKGGTPVATTTGTPSSGTEIQPGGYATIPAGYYANPTYIYAKVADQQSESRAASGFSLNITGISSTNLVSVGTTNSNGTYPLTGNISATGTFSASTTGWFSSGSATDSSVSGAVGKIDAGKTDIVPATYQVLEYIASTGTQVIDTGYTLTSNNLVFEDVYEYAALTNGEACIGGLGGNGTCFEFGNNSSMFFNYRSNGGSSAYPASITPVANTKYYYKAMITGDSYICEVNGSAGNPISYTNNLVGQKVWINRYYSNSHQLNGKQYSIRIYDNNILVRDFIPVKRVSDNVLGFYDIVNGGFYTNSGSGTFTAGNAIAFDTNTTNNKTINEEAELKVDAGYYHEDLYFKGWNTVGTYEAGAAVTNADIRTKRYLTINPANGSGNDGKLYSAENSTDTNGLTGTSYIRTKGWISAGGKTVYLTAGSIPNGKTFTLNASDGTLKLGGGLAALNGNSQTVTSLSGAMIIKTANANLSVETLASGKTLTVNTNTGTTNILASGGAINLGSSSQTAAKTIATVNINGASSYKTTVTTLTNNGNGIISTLTNNGTITSLGNAGTIGTLSGAGDITTISTTGNITTFGAGGTNKAITNYTAPIAITKMTNSRTIGQLGTGSSATGSITINDNTYGTVLFNKTNYTPISISKHKVTWNAGNTSKVLTGDDGSLVTTTISVQAYNDNDDITIGSLASNKYQVQAKLNKIVSRDHEGWLTDGLNISASATGNGLVNVGKIKAGDVSLATMQVDSTNSTVGFTGTSLTIDTSNDSGFFSLTPDIATAVTNVKIVSGSSGGGYIPNNYQKTIDDLTFTLNNRTVYINAIAIGSSKLTTFSASHSANKIANMTGTINVGTYSASGTIDAVTGSHTITNLGTSSTAGTITVGSTVSGKGTLNVTTNAGSTAITANSGTTTISTNSGTTTITTNTGTVNINGGNADKGVKVAGKVATVDQTTVSNDSGDLITTSRSASLASTSAGSASMTPTGFTASGSATSYYVTLSTSSASAKPRATTGTGWVTSGNTDGTNTSIPVSGNGNVIYIPTGTISTGTTNQTSYTQNTSAVVPANGYLYIGAGYYPNTQISLSTLIPDDGNYTNAGSGQIRKNYEAYDTSGNKLIGTINDLTPSSTYYTTTNTGLGGLTGGTYLTATRYIIAGTAGAISGGGLTHSDTTFSAGTDYLTTTNTGLAVTATNTASRAAASYSITKAGWISSPGSGLSASGNDVKTITRYIKTGVAKNGYVTTAGWIAKNTQVYTLSYDSTEQCVDFVFNN